MTAEAVPFVKSLFPILFITAHQLTSPKLDSQPSVTLSLGRRQQLNGYARYVTH